MVLWSKLKSTQWQSWDGAPASSSQTVNQTAHHMVYCIPLDSGAKTDWSVLLFLALGTWDNLCNSSQRQVRAFQVNALADDWRVLRMSGLWATNNSCDTGRRNPGLVRWVAWLMEPLAHKMNKKITIAPVWSADEKLLIGYCGKDMHARANARRVIWITAVGREEASTWRQQATFRVQWNPGRDLSASCLKFTRPPVPQHITALKAGPNAVSDARKRGLRTCR